MQNNLCPQCQSPIPADAPGGICPGCALLGVSLPTSPTQVAGASVPMLDEVAAAFPELEVLELYGQGGMGAVFKARQPKLDRFVALKILTPALATQPGFAERFTREARALAKLSHPNIVGVHDFGESGGYFYLLMEFVDGVNLRQAMRAGVSPEQALLLVPKVCEALQFAHDHGVLHRDIKPENILLDTHGVPKLADFGIAKFGDDKSTGLTQSGAQLGTAAYMAPEQIEQPATVDHRADIYSLGVVLYEMLTGELPLGRFAAPSEKSHCSGGVDDVVLRALEKQRERRQQSATEMKTQVENASERTTPPPLPRRSVPFSRAAAVGATFCISSIPFGLILFLFVKATINASLDTQGQLNGPIGGNIIIFGFIPAFIGVALGWKAVGDFRYHRGHLRGGGTAVFAALGIPVFAVIVTALVNFEDIDRAINPLRIGWAGTLVACLVVLAAFAASIWAVRALWRFVHSGPPGVPVHPRPAPNWGLRIFWLLAGFIGIPVLLVALGLIIPQMQASRARNQAMPALEAEPEIRKAEDEAIERAGQNLHDTKQRVAVGVATPDDEAEAEMQVAIAEARGDKVRILEATIAYLEIRILMERERIKVGVSTPAILTELELKLATEKLELQRLKSSKGARP